jgi:hypothetical protein
MNDLEEVLLANQGDSMSDLAPSGGEATVTDTTTTNTEVLDGAAAEAAAEKPAESTSATLPEASESTDTTDTDATDEDADKTEEDDKDSKEDVPKLMSQAQIDKIVAGRLKSLTDEKVATKAAELAKDALASSEEVKKENVALKQELDAIKIAAKEGIPSSILIKSKLAGKELEEFAAEYVAERKGWGFKPAADAKPSLADRLNESVSSNNADSFNEARIQAVKAAI